MIGFGQQVLFLDARLSSALEDWLQIVAEVPLGSWTVEVSLAGAETLTERVRAPAFEALVVVMAGCC